MEQRLTKGVYGHQFNRANNLFGIRCGQIRSHEFVHNGGWYNQQGEKLGWGDLTAADLQRISRELQDGELFVILPESASFWKFVEKESAGPIGSMCATTSDEQAPGIDYVAAECSYIIARGTIHIVSRYTKETDGTFEYEGVTFTRLAPDKANQLLAQ
ncbi:MAG: hypothetical protein Q8L52_00330 [bacterium]|nr:hypothetical protein [bacterium]